MALLRRAIPSAAGPPPPRPPPLPMLRKIPSVYTMISQSLTPFQKAEEAEEDANDDDDDDDDEAEEPKKKVSCL